jgi:hypothetical protein
MKRSGIIGLQPVSFSRLVTLLLVLLFHGTSFSQVLNVTQASVIEGFAGKTPNLTGASGVAVQGNYAYVIGTGDVLQVLDITLPGLPIPKGNLYHGTGGASILRAQSIVVRGNYAYITSYGANAFEIVDISEPTKPVHKAALYDGGGSAPYLNQPWGLFISGSYAYVASTGSAALEIIDISNPSDPKHKGSVPLPANPFSVAVMGDFAYIGTNQGTLEVINVSNPSSPTHQGSLLINSDGIGQHYGIAVSGNYAYLTDWIHGSFEIIDVSNPTVPVAVGHLDDGGNNDFTIAGPPYLLGAWSVSVSGKYAYISLNSGFVDPTGVETANEVGALEVVDISNPTLPVHAGAGLFTKETTICRNMFVSGDKAYMPGRVYGTITIADLSNPLSPKFLGLASNGTGGALINFPSAVVVDGNYAYIGNRGNKTINGPAALEIVNIADPTRPVHEGSLDVLGGALLQYTASIYKNGNYVYAVSDRNNSLQVVDVTVPIAPVKRGGYQGSATKGAKSIVVDPNANVAYIAGGTAVNPNTGAISQGSNSIAIFDISNPDVPALIGSLANGGGSAPYLNDPSSVVQSGNYLYVASSGSNALEIIQIINSNTLGHAGKLLNGGGSAPYLNAPAAVTVQGKYAYVVSAGSKALEIVDITNPASPVHAGSFIDGQQGVSLAGVNAVKVSGNYAYITTSTFVSGAVNNLPGILIVIDISNPAAPKLVDTFFSGEGGALMDNPTSVFVAGPYAYITNAGLSMNLNVAYLFGPQISNVQPASAPVGTSVTITGQNFNTFLTVAVNSIPATITNVTATTLTFTVPPGATNGKIGLTLNGQKISSATNFIVSPTSSAAADVQQNSFTAQWSDVGAAGYFLDLTTDNFSTFVTGYNSLSVGNVTSLAISGLNSGASYQYRVRSSDGTLTSINSNIINVLTIPSTPPAISATLVDQASFTANWTSVTGATDYFIDVASVQDFSKFLVGYNNLRISSAVGQSQLVNGLSSYVKYYYRVRSANATGSSPSSNVIQVLTLDITAPVISAAVAPNPTTVSAGTAPVFNSIITDNVSVDSAKIFYRGIAQKSFKSAMLQGPGGLGGNYSVTVQSTWYDSLGLEYYFQAIDKAGNKTVNASNYVQLITPSISLPALPTGPDQSDYRIVSFPYNLPAGNKVTTVYSNVPWNDNTKAGMWWWNPTVNSDAGAYDQYSATSSLQTVEPGKGYWMITSAPSTTTLSNVPAPKYNSANLFSMTLKPKWNEIGNPYPVPISWDDVIAFNQTNNPGALFSPLNIFDGTGYTSTAGNLLPAFQGGFVKNLGTSDITILIPFPGQKTLGSTGGRMASTRSDNLNESDWNIALHISQNEKTNRLGGFGMHPLAKSGMDQFDNFNPPGFLEIPEVNFKNAEFPDVTFANDVVHTQDEYVWSFTPEGTLGTQAQLTWNADMNSTKELFLLDEQQLKIVDMSHVNQYDFVLTKSSTFRVFYGDDVQHKINTSRVVAGAPYPNPLTSDNKASINLALPEMGSEYSVNLQIYNGQGEVIGTVNTRLSSGIHPVEFTMSSALSSGVYLYKLAASNDKTSNLYTGKIIKP